MHTEVRKYPNVQSIIALEAKFEEKYLLNRHQPKVNIHEWAKTDSSPVSL
jgi:hypothetical protein